MTTAQLFGGILFGAEVFGVGIPSGPATNYDAMSGRISVDYRLAGDVATGDRISGSVSAGTMDSGSILTQP